MKVIKRSLKTVEFDCNKIRIAVQKAMDEVGNKDELLANAVTSGVTNKIIQKELKEITVENIQDIVEETLLQFGMVDVARAYIRYRYLREMDRKTKEKNETIFGLVNSSASDELYKENSNKDARVVNTMRDYIAGETCKTLASEYYPKDILEAHKNGLIHLHDMDYSPVMPLHNCELINLEDMLQNGTVINGKLIEKPHSFRTACTIATQVVAGVTSSSYGGATINLAHLVPFVNESRKSITKRFKEYFPNMEEKELNNAIEKEVSKEIRDSIQTIQYQLNTLNTTNGQAPFISIFMYIDELEGQEREDMVKCISEILKQRIDGIKNPQGHPVTVAFPKLLYVLDEDNDHESSKYWELTKLAAECTAKRLVPDYISAKKMRELKEGNVFGCMGCRSFLQPYYENGKPKFWGRFNQGVVTINLPDVALSSHGDFDAFWKLLDERLELCHRALQVRHKRLLGVKSDVAPILWQHGALARLKEGETIDKLLFNDYSSISLGYAGLYETVKYMTGMSHHYGDGKEFGLSVMRKLNEACNKWKKAENIGYSVYGTPIENTVTKFVKCLKKRFGEVKDITDKNYITNSYHMDVREKMSIFEKLKVESEFQELSLGGTISYGETPNMTKNIEAVLEVIKFISNNIMYAELNTTTSYCRVCGCTDISMGDDLKFHCPQCGNDDFDKMDIALRVCGYISTNPFSEGRASDIKNRRYHLDDEEMCD